MTERCTPDSESRYAGWCLVAGPGVLDHFIVRRCKQHFREDHWVCEHFRMDQDGAHPRRPQVFVGTEVEVVEELRCFYRAMLLEQAVKSKLCAFQAVLGGPQELTASINEHAPGGDRSGPADVGTRSESGRDPLALRSEHQLKGGGTMKGLLEGIWAGLLMGTVLGLAACAEVSPAHDQRSVMVLEFATADGREYVALEPVRMWLEEPLENVVLVEMRYVVSVEGQEYRATPPEVLAVWLDPVDAYMLDVGGAPRPSLVGQI